MTKASDNAFPSILITEGTEPSAPAAGTQRVYIDSTSHKLKRTDSSGTDVTIEGAATGAVTGSGLTMATARLLGRTTASTGAIEEITVGSGLSLAAGALTATGGGTSLNPGTSFPGSPAANDLCYRTDRDLLYFYDGTRWLTLHLYREDMSMIAGSTTTSGAIAGRLPIWHTTYDMWLETFYTSSYVATTNTGAAFWTMTLKKYQSDFSTAANVATPDTSADAANTLVTKSTAIGALLVPATYKSLSFEVTKTGSPGAIHPMGAVAYRLVG